MNTTIQTEAIHHLTLTVTNLARAVEFYTAMLGFQKAMDKQGVPHGEIEDLGPDLSIYVLAFRDPDNIQLELTAPYG